jgi:cytoskeletal protein CcmA (bactofilin family)
LFNKDALFGKKDEPAPADTRAVNVTPDLRGTPARTGSAAQPEVQSTRLYAEPPKAPAAADELAGSKLIVGPDIKLKGVEITDCDTLVVEGRVEASMDSRVVQIAEHGVFTGTATMDVAEIWGTFEGTLTARKQLVVYASGRVSGQIRYGKIRIEEGGELSGEVSTLSREQSITRDAQPAAKQESENRGAAYEPVRAAKQPGKAGASTV